MNSINPNNIEQLDTSYTLLFDRVISPIDDDGGLIVDEE
jgi:hypothetical protein